MPFRRKILLGGEVSGAFGVSEVVPGRRLWLPEKASCEVDKVDCRWAFDVEGFVLLEALGAVGGDDSGGEGDNSAERADRDDKEESGRSAVGDREDSDDALDMVEDRRWKIEDWRLEMVGALPENEEVKSVIFGSVVFERVWLPEYDGNGDGLGRRFEDEEVLPVVPLLLLPFLLAAEVKRAEALFRVCELLPGERLLLRNWVLEVFEVDAGDGVIDWGDRGEGEFSDERDDDCWQALVEIDNEDKIDDNDDDDDRSRDAIVEDW